MDKLVLPTTYQPQLDLHETQIAIKRIKDYFQLRLAERLNLLRVSCIDVKGDGETSERLLLVVFLFIHIAVN